MSRFTSSDPFGHYLPDGVRFQIREDMVYAVGAEFSIELIIVPDGFITDFASIPVPIQAIIPKSIGRRAAILHDYLYFTQGLSGKYSRKECDQIFLEALKVLGVRWTQRQVLYLGVRVGGWVAWNNHKNEK